MNFYKSLLGDYKIIRIVLIYNNKKMQITEINQSDSPLIDVFTNWKNKNFIENKPNCSKDNEALFICTDKNCTK